MALVGDNWLREFLELASREKKEKLKHTLSKIKFFLNYYNGFKEKIYYRGRLKTQ